MSAADAAAVVACEHGRRLALPRGAAALLAIDMQRDFLDPRGFCAHTGDDVAPLRAILPRFSAVLEAARGAGLAVVHTRECYAADLSDVHALKRERESVGLPGPLGRFLLHGEAGTEIVPEVAPAPHEPTVDKPGFSAFYRTGLEASLHARGITHLVLMGITTQCCVHSTLRAAVDRGFRCLTVADCCAAFDPSLHDAALSLVYGENHLFGWVTTAAPLIDALDGA